MTLEVRLVDDDQRLRAPWMVGDGFAVLHEQHPVRQPADLHLLPDKAEGHRISAPLEADEAVEADRTAHDDVERLDQRVGQWRQVVAFARPSLRDTGSGRRAAQLQRPRLKPPVSFRLKLLKAPGGQLVGIDDLPKILYRPLDLALRLRMTGLAGREERRIKAMLKVSKIPTGQTLENFDFAFQPAIERSRIETLATGSWIRSAEVLLLQGPPGVGKSHLLVALGIRAIELGFSAQYFRFDELMTALKADAHLPASRIKARKYMSTALLLIDEMGYDPMNRQEASLFFRLVSHRYGRGAMIITTNKTVRDWPELLAGDEVLATAILDRLLHRAHVLNIRGRSYRLRDLEASLKN